jgi:natural product precursor
MKKLNKLSINTEKVIKNEELVNLKGGYTNGDCTGTYYVCESDYDQFMIDYYNNCGSGSDVTIMKLMGC